VGHRFLAWGEFLGQLLGKTGESGAVSSGLKVRPGECGAGIACFGAYQGMVLCGPSRAVADQFSMGDLLNRVGDKAELRLLVPWSPQRRSVGGHVVINVDGVVRLDVAEGRVGQLAH
jgi:hypothetical protein